MQPGSVLADTFNTFFISKNDDIVQSIPHTQMEYFVQQSHCTFTEFEIIHESTVKKVCLQVSSATQPGEIVHPQFLKDFPFFYHARATIINCSFVNSTFSTAFNHGVVLPNFKNGDPDNFPNYRPKTNLHFASKVMEKVSALQLTNYLCKNSLFDSFQSAYRSFHSTETALLEVTASFLHRLDHWSTYLLVALDLSAAFDTVDHMILFNFLHQVGIWGKALALLKCYLTDRTQQVLVKGYYSWKSFLTRGFPQG